ncbi:hypothetical protein SAMN06297387_10369 [Streptomyces zhaozhouensis]|uniref:Secreted protein n=1 Tax=Streptomyces zhaozhouensis TaxID=1300267 RepID=A0A286DRI3_9ACTN|nr:DUF6167 family protein [Streptomyces zhaozhouensis]SOD61285.1 hypothetical protein SAMN06297387_10369 [Streptomyces zhaozhouensis]
MIRRAFWFTTGAVAGVWATTKVQRKLRSLAPDSLALRAADRAVAGGQRLRLFAGDVRAGMVEREDQLHDALGLTAPPDGERALPLEAGRTEPPAPAAAPPARPRVVRAARTERTIRPHAPKRLTGKEDH